MNKEQKRVIKELKQFSIKLGHSPKRKETPSDLVWKSYKYFGSFNKAKQKAKLELFSAKNPEIERRYLKRDLDLVRIVAFINFDGHLSKDLKSFYYSSKNIEDVKLFAKIIKRKFNVKCKIKENSTGSSKQTNICWIFNSNLAGELSRIGVAKGDKVVSSYLISRWITSNKKFSKEFLKIAFFCEGSIREEKSRNLRIRFSMHKSEILLKNGINYVNQIKSMLSKFNIQTTPIYVSDAKIRKDGIKPKLLAFRINLKDSNNFINKIGWLK